jgi:hypothetical protein
MIMASEKCSKYSKPDPAVLLRVQEQGVISNGEPSLCIILSYHFSFRDNFTKMRNFIKIRVYYLNVRFSEFDSLVTFPSIIGLLSSNQP